MFYLFLALGNLGQRIAGPKLLTEYFLNNMTSKKALPSSEDTLFFKYIFLVTKVTKSKVKSRIHNDDCLDQNSNDRCPLQILNSWTGMWARLSV